MHLLLNSSLQITRKRSGRQLKESSQKFNTRAADTTTSKRKWEDWRTRDIWLLNTRRIWKFVESFNWLFVFATYIIPKSANIFWNCFICCTCFYWLFDLHWKNFDKWNLLLANYKMDCLQQQEENQHWRGGDAQPMKIPSWDTKD